MSAALFGASLLENVQEESLAQILADLRQSIEPQPKCILGIAPLDRLLDLFRFPHVYIGAEAETYVRTSPEPTNIDDQTLEHGSTNIAGHRISFGRPNPVLIELGHSCSGTGKTNLLYQITAISILSKAHMGKEATVVWLDTTISFSATRLYQVCLNLLNQVNDLDGTTTTQSIAEEALKHVHIFSISSSKQLLSVLDNLERYLLRDTSHGESHQSHHSSHRPLSLIVLDSATAFYWTDRFDAEIARLESIRAPGTVSTIHQTQSQARFQPTQTQTQTHPQAQSQLVSTPTTTATQTLTKLKSLSSTFNCTCIYTTTTTTSTTTNQQPQTNINTNTSNPQLYTPHPRPEHQIAPLTAWTQSATLSLTFTRIPTPRFASEMDIAECLRDRGKRQEIVRRNRIRVGVHEEWLGGVVRDRKVRRALGRLEGRGGFVLCVTERGVDVES